MIRRPPRSTRTDTLFPYTTLFRSHVHRPLRDGVEIELPTLQRGLLERRIPDRQRVEVGLDAPALAVRRLHRAMPARRQAELLQHLAVELQGDRLLARQPAPRLGVGARTGESRVGQGCVRTCQYRW